MIRHAVHFTLTPAGAMVATPDRAARNWAAIARLEAAGWRVVNVQPYAPFGLIQGSRVHLRQTDEKRPCPKTRRSCNRSACSDC